MPVFLNFARERYLNFASRKNPNPPLSNPIFPTSEAYPHGALSRSFQLPNFTNLASFTTNTQNTASADIIITPTGKDPQAILWLHSPEGITRSLIRSAVETETEYRKLVGSDAVSAPQRIGIYQVRTLERLQALISKNAEKNTVPRPENRVRMKPGHVPLPPAPLIPASPPPPLTEVDFETYIAPLFDNGWQMSGIRTRGDVNFKGLSSLARAYRFTTYSAARHFLQAAVALMPAPVPGSVAGVRIEMHSTPSFYEVSLESMSELAPGALQKYGISLADARFAIEVENEISKNWAEHVDASAASPRFIPKTLEELWNRRPSPKPRPYLVYP
ncbi:hypothetical protein DFH07DRAFT_785266 [Mycena maculata]|uniref:Uncharacterized protein n=1 Tax=Mycena maculata TaxID=230809 RepID=A0AAD7MHG2_9AGAR|nr:hypothetical protein DFH07DRAFT_785266 [Mycena maculata]